MCSPSVSHAVRAICAICAGRAARRVQDDQQMREAQWYAELRAAVARVGALTEAFLQERCDLHPCAWVPTPALLAAYDAYVHARLSASDCWLLWRRYDTVWAVCVLCDAVRRQGHATAPLRLHGVGLRPDPVADCSMDALFQACARGPLFVGGLRLRPAPPGGPQVGG